MPYFDHAATTRPSPGAVEAVRRAMTEDWGNPSSLYAFGMRAEDLLRDAAGRAAALLGCSAEEIFFTSGGTEANALAVLGAARARRGGRVVISAVEHDSVFESAAQLEREGFEVVRVPPERDGNIRPESVVRAVNRDTVLVSLMLVNNETGAVFPVRSVTAAVRAAGFDVPVHCDAVQAFGKMPVRVRDLGVDMLTASAHKIHGPKGCGLLYRKSGVRVSPLLFGGEQQRRFRPGTEPVPAVAGFAAAMAEVDPERSLRAVRPLYGHLRAGVIRAGYPVHSPENGSPYLLNFSVPGFPSETLLHALEQRGILVSSGSACGKGKPSRVLRAMGLPEPEVRSALRVSLDPENTPEEADCLLAALADCTRALARRR